MRLTIRPAWKLFDFFPSCNHSCLNPFKHRCPVNTALRNYRFDIHSCHVLSRQTPALICCIKSLSTDMASVDHKNLRDIFSKTLESVQPQKMIHGALKFEGNSLFVKDKSYNVQNNVYVVGFGKAVLGMARAVDDLLHQHIVKGVISIPLGYNQFLTGVGKKDLSLRGDSKILVYEGAKDNLPDEAAHMAAQEIWTLVRNLRENSLLIVLVSGGGSSLLPLPCPPITLEEEHQLTKLLSTSGGSISDLNIVRKQIEVLKGGGLAQEARPAQVVTLIMSDVIGDKLDIIASGPTVKDIDTTQMCLEVFRRLNIYDQVPTSVMDYITQKAFEERQNINALKTVLPVENVNAEDWHHVQNIIVGSNAIATKKAFDVALSLKYVPFILSTELEGEAKEIGSMFAKLAVYISQSYGSLQFNDAGSQAQRSTEFDLVKSGLQKSVLNEVVGIAKRAYNLGQSVCIIAGGETTVKLEGTGKGGRAQEMSVAFGVELKKLMSQGSVSDKFSIEFLSSGTDGQDGPTSAAGGIIDGHFTDNCRDSDMDPEKFLQRNDTFTLLNEVKGGMYHVITGFTGTNVMDIQLLTVRYKQAQKVGQP